MDHNLEREAVAAVMRRISQAWLTGRFEDLGPLMHPEIIAVFPGFAGRARGREAFIDGFREFSANAAISEFREQDQQVDVVGETAVVTYRYEIVYERSGQRYHGSGRDVWVFELKAGKWLAVWRTMLEIHESAA